MSLPTLKHYTGTQLNHIAFPLGGIGTGTISLSGRGSLQDFECMNRPAKGYTPELCFFSLRTQASDGSAIARLLEGPLPDHLVLGATGSRVPQAGLPRFASATFDAAYPFATVHLQDPAVPLKVRLEAFNPLTPPDVEDSAWPVASLRWVLKNTSRKPVKASIAASLLNFIGSDGSKPQPGWGGYPTFAPLYKRNRNIYRQGDHCRGLKLHSEGLTPADECWGTLALTTTATKGITHRTSWADLSWGDKLLNFWDDFSADGKLTDQPIGNQQAPIASLCVSVIVPPGGEVEIPFLLAWHFPNRQTWTPAPKPTSPEPAAAGRADPTSPLSDRIGNHYCTRFADAFDAADQFSAKAASLQARTTTFVSSLLSADVPEIVKEACLFNLSSLRSQTTFMTEDGHFFGWEGCHPHEGSCHGSCTHVWNYEAALPQLFGSLARDQRTLEFAHATDASGLMSFRIHLPLPRAQSFGLAAADGQMGCIVRLYREWRSSGHTAFLRSLYPHMKRAMQFAWLKGSWDADKDGVMEGCQHNTMDVEYFGPNPQMQAWYLAALLAASEMATAMNDHAFAQQCDRLFVSGSAKTDKQLFNGDYYEHKIMPPGKKFIRPGLRIGIGSSNLTDPDLQLGAGCLVDQLAGQFVAHQARLGHVLSEDNITATLLSIHRHNFRPSLDDHFNHLRSYALGHEPATLMATYPKGRRPKRPFPYFNEVMTGFEYTAAVGMLQEGLTEEGLELIAAVRSRHTGTRRNPFEEPECGHHYARALAVWAALSALQKTAYDGRTATLTIGQPGTSFFATGEAYGTVTITPTSTTLLLHEGLLHLETLALPTARHPIARTLIAPYELQIKTKVKPKKKPKRR